MTRHGSSSYPRPIRHRIRLVAVAALLGLASAPLTAGPAHAADPVTLNLLGINDFHGRIDANTVKWAGTLERLRQEGGEANTLFISGGDNISASLFASAVQDDQPTIDVLNALKLNGSSVGNHEFDKGFEDLEDRVIDGGENAKWDYLGANVYDRGTTAPALDPYSVYTVDGVRVGVIGAVTVETPTLVSPAGIADLEFGQPVAAVNRVADELTDGSGANGEADVLVAAYHEGAAVGEGTATSPGSTLAAEVAKNNAFTTIVNQTSPKVAAIFTAHTHQKYAWDAPVPGQAGKTRPVVQTGSYGDNIGQVKLTVDRDADDAVTGYTAVNVPRTTDSDGSLIAAYPRVAAVQKIVTDALAYAEVQGNVPVGKVTADITTAYTDLDGDGAYETTDTRDNRALESTLGGVVANSLRERLSDPALGGAEIGVVNPGGLRAELLYAGNTATNPANTDGVVTYAEANAVLPFANNLNTVSLTGAQFVTMLEQQWQRDAAGAVPTRAYLQLGLSNNVSYTFHEVDDPAIPGAKLGVIDSVSIAGKPLDLARSYRIGTFSFLTAGGDNFRVFTEGTEPRDSGLVDRDAWIDYLRANQPISPSFARRSVQVSNQPTMVDAGSTVAFGLSKLDLTSVGSPKNTLVEVTLVNSAQGIEVGTFPVSAGAASVSFTAPKAGRYTLVATASPTNTTVTFPLTVAAVATPPAITYRVRTVVNRTTERVALVVTATNDDTVKEDIRFTTAWGDTVKFYGVEPGETVRHRFASGQGHLDAGTVRISAYKWQNGQGSYEVFRPAYEAVTATVDPRGRVTASVSKANTVVVQTARFTNRGGDPVSVQLTTPYGTSKTKTVQPGRAVNLKVATGEASTPRTRGEVTATKTVDGRTYTTVFAVRFPAR